MATEIASLDIDLLELMKTPRGRLVAATTTHPSEGPEPGEPDMSTVYVSDHAVAAAYSAATGQGTAALSSAGGGASVRATLEAASDLQIVKSNTAEQLKSISVEVGTDTRAIAAKARKMALTALAAKERIAGEALMDRPR